MCNSISNKKYINESIINSFIIGFDSEVTSTYMYTNLFSKKKKKKITNHNIVFIILQFDHFMSLYNQNIIVHMSCIWR